MSLKDTLSHYIVYQVEKFEAKDAEEIERLGLEPYDVVESTPDAIKINCLLNEGITVLINLLCGLSSPQDYDNAAAYLGVGDDATAPSASQTGLSGSSKFYSAMNVGYPQISGQDAVWQADFEDGEAEWAWLEETVCNGSSDSGDNLCRQNTSLGTKPAGQTWRLTATITFS